MPNVGSYPLSSREARLLGHVRNPECYREVPLFSEELLDGFCTAGWAVVGVLPERHGKSPRPAVLTALDRLTSATEEIPHA